MAAVPTEAQVKDYLRALSNNGNLAELGRACAGRRRWEFLLTIAPLRLKTVTGSPVNPVAVF